ncbi:MAG TPA: hypothetical protein PKA53_03400 [Sphingobacterium sp.]|nr:hypothetical protein [Sphingobacterium sp.]
MESNYQLSRIHNYINGLMSKEEMHALEREALEDPFLQDAIDGYALQQGVDARQLSLLQKRLVSRVEAQAVGRDRRFYSWQRLAVGTTAAVMFVTVCILLLIKYLPQQQPTAGLTEVEIMQENTYAISLQPYQEGAEPVEGWTDYEIYLNKNFQGNHDEVGVLHVTFKIDGDGKPYDIQEETNGKNHLSFDDLKVLLQNGPAWQGEQARIAVDIHKLDL